MGAYGRRYKSIILVKIEIVKNKKQESGENNNLLSPVDYENTMKQNNTKTDKGEYKRVSNRAIIDNM